MKGSVKMFNKEKGYGFIHTDEGKDIFFHFRALNDGSHTIDQNTNVEFELEESERGPRAINIKKI